MEKLADLPTPALITLGATLAVIFAARYLGLINGERSGPVNSPAAAQVAAVIVDPTALNNATAAVDRLSHATIEGHELAKNHTHMVCRRVDALVDEVEGLTRTLADLRVELARRH